MVYGGKQHIWQGEGSNDELQSVTQSLVKVIASEFSVTSSHTLGKTFQPIPRAFAIEKR